MREKGREERDLKGPSKISEFRTPMTGKKRVYTTVETLLFSFSGSEAPWCIPFFPDLWCIPFSLVFPGKWYTPWLFLLGDVGVGRQTEKRGVPRR